MFQILFCDNTLIIRFFYYIKLFLNLIRFLVPIGLIIKLSIDLYKNMFNTYDNKDNIIKKSGDRIIACIIIFCIPTFVNLILALLNHVDINTGNDVSLATCYTEANIDLIRSLEKQEQDKLTAQEEAERLNNLALVAKGNAKIQALIEANKNNFNNNGNSNNSTGSYNDKTTDFNKQNGVYIKDGTFYVPKYKDWDENTFSGRNCPSDPLNQGYNNELGFNNYFWDMLSSLIKAAQDAGYNLKTIESGVGGGCRSYTTQYNFYYETYKNQPGRAARPGKSLHGFGIASDLTFYKDKTTQCGNSRTRTNCPGMAWVHDHAADFGLEFPLNKDTATFKEDWHIQPIKLERY